MGCVIHEEIFRNKLRNQIQFPHVTNATVSQAPPLMLPLTTPPPPPSMQQPNQANGSLVQLNRDQFIEQMANTYADGSGNCSMDGFGEPGNLINDWLE